MKNFSQKALVAAAVAACGVSAHAGTVAAASVRTYAVEALTSTTAVTVDTISYTMGVARASSQGFTVILRQPSGSTTSLVCPAAPTVGTNAAGAAIVTVKRSSATECAYDVDLNTNSTNVAVGNTINFTGVGLNSHGLAVVGGSESLNIALYDTGETARVDNSADKTFTVANSAAAVTLGAAADTATSADVGYNSGNSPLFGFIAGGDDTATNAVATFNIGINSTLVNAAGNAVTNAVIGNVVVTVSGDFSGLVTTFNAAAGNSVVTVAGPNASTPAVTYTAGGASSTAVFTVAGGSNLNAAGTATNVSVKLVTAATQSLGTSRTFGVSGVVNPAIGAQRTLTGNSSWWTWTANAIELRSPFFNNDNSTGNLTRFFFQNTGAAASYSAACQAESGVTVTYGTAKTGTLGAGLTAVNAADICTFSTGKRGSITFTINSSIGKVKGVYQQAVNGSSTAYIALDRPFGTNTY